MIGSWAASNCALVSDVPELGVAFGWRAARLRASGVDLGREAEVTEQARHCRTARRMCGGVQGGAQVTERTALALCTSAHRITGRLGSKQRFESWKKLRILRLALGASTAGGADTLDQTLNQSSLKFASPAADRAAIKAGDQ
jgi:hypothetical protein